MTSRALPISAFFLASLSPLASLGAIGCPASHIDRQARVSQVYDGDTVRLQNGQIIRIIGINTPEVGRKGKPGEPFARAAGKKLRSLLAAQNQQIALRYGAEGRDRYRRHLAHAYLPDGRNISALMLRAGLAVQVTIPPNTHHYRCYRKAEQSARKARRGLWSRPGWVTRVGDLRDRARGFYIVRGTVSTLGQRAGTTWLSIENRLILRIDAADRAYFAGLPPRQLVGKTIRVRGWISSGKKKLRMRLRHPMAITVE